MLQRQIYVDVVDDDWNLYCFELMTRCLKPRDESLLVNILINLSYKFISLIKLRDNKERIVVPLVQPESTDLPVAALTILIMP